jgi:hypothetical protein
MKRFRRYGVLPALTVFLSALILTGFTTKGQQKFRSDDMVIQVKGAASTGKWEIKSEKGQLETVLGLTNSKITGLYSLWFIVECESLQSDESKLTKDAHKALKSSANEQINFVLSNARVKEVSTGVYEMNCQGFLTIGGVEKPTDLKVTCRLNDDKSYTCTGNKKLKMSEFDIKLSPAIMNSLKPVDDIDIVYQLKISRIVQ